MDYDIEMGEAGDAYGHEETAPVNDILPIEDEQEPGEVDEDAPNGSAQAEDQTMVLTKVYLQGVDVLNTNQIKSYVQEHLSSGSLQRVEWINDTSANLLFHTESAAAEAIRALSSIEIADATQLPPLELIPAKPFSEKADAPLQIRYAVLTDKKKANAAESSRFYLLNPDWDPAERKRTRGYRDHDGGYGNRRNGRGRRDNSVEVYDASMYDDNDAEEPRRSPPRTWYGRDGRRNSRSYSRSRSRSRPRSDRNDDRYARANRGKELFDDLGNGRRKDGLQSSRNRSASPARSVNGDLRMDDEEEERRASRRNRDGARSIKERLSATSSRNNNNKKELFPSKSSNGSNAVMDRVGGDAHIERISTSLSGMSISPSTGTSNAFSVDSMDNVGRHGGSLPLTNFGFTIVKNSSESGGAAAPKDINMQQS